MENFDLRKYLAEGRLLKEVSAEYVNKDAYNYKVGDIIGNTIDGFDFEVIRIEGDKVTVRDVTGNVKGGKEFKTYKDNMYKGGVGLKEFIKKELEDRNEPLYAKLVPSNGDAETLEGEMLRAINRIIYRWFNSGDKYYEGYGTETAGPAHSFLVNARHPQRSAMNTLFKEFVSDAEYERILNDVLDVILDHIESRQGKYTKNTLGGIFDYEPEFEDMEEDDDDYTYDYDDEYEDDDYYQE